MTTKRMSRLCDRVFVTYILQTFNEGIVSGLADIISVFNLSLNFVKEVKGKCGHWISYPPSKFKKSGSQWWHIHSILDVPLK
jgi:hypothetical protein